MYPGNARVDPLCWKVVCQEHNLHVTQDGTADVVYDSEWRSTYSKLWNNIGNYVSDKVVNDSTLTGFDESGPDDNNIVVIIIILSNT